MNIIKKIANFIYKKKYYILFGALAIGSYFYLNSNIYKQIKQTKLSYFIAVLESKYIKQVILQGNFLLFKTQYSEWYKTNISGIPKTQIFQLIKNTSNITFSCKQPDIQIDLAKLFFVTSSLGTIIYYQVHKLIQSDKFNIKKTLSRPVYFSQIYGNQFIKQKLYEIIDFIKNSQKYQKIGARMRRGILLYGPPGTGKTMIARAAACESGIDFLYCSASQFQQIYVGVGPKRIRQLFAEARTKINGCIVFIDQFDAIGSRSNDNNGSQAEKNSTINQLLTQMDGFYESTKIIIMAATNRQNMIDEAILRSGRFDTKIKTQLPNLQQRKGIIKIHLKKKLNQITEQVIELISKNTSGASGAELQYIVNQSAYISLRDNKEVIQDNHLVKSLEKVLKGKPILNIDKKFIK